MTVKREDLLAAASVGVLHYTQVDPLLVYLLQRDVNEQRQAMLRQKRGSRMSGKHVMLYMAAILVIGLVAAMVAFYTKLAFDALGPTGILWFIGLYALVTVGVAAWFEGRQIGLPVRIFSTSVIALVPLAIFASQQFRIY
jgi:hypothetical protein